MKVETNPWSTLQPGSDLTLGYTNPSGKGRHLIISHIGSNAGFLNGAQDVSRSWDMETTTRT